MKRQIRFGVFETNSSSVHSVTVQPHIASNLPHNLKVDEYDNKIHMNFGEFGWRQKEYFDAYTKLQYALTMTIETEQYYHRQYPHKYDLRIKSKEDFYNCEGFKAINELIKRVCNCDGIKIDSDIQVYNGWLRHEGYIDHQSFEDYKNLNEFLNDIGLSLEEFIFDSNVALIIDNDNH